MPTLYADDGSIRVTVVSGASLTGLHAPDGSLNIYIDASDVAPNGNYHPCGAMRCTIIATAPTTPVSYYAPDGSTNITVMPLRIPGIMAVTVVAGSLAMISQSGTAAILDTNFQKNYTVLQGTLTNAISPYTFSRASSGLAENKNKTWTTFASGQPRITDKGILLEGARTNSIRNNSMQGVPAVGTINGVPTNWIAATNDSLLITFMGSGTEFGLDYVDYKFSGTTVVGGLVCYVAPENKNNTAAVYGQIWSASCFFKLISGTMNLVTPQTQIVGWDATLTTALNSYFSADLTSQFTPGNFFRSAVTNIIQASGVAFVEERVFRFVSPPAGTVVNCTIRMYSPQLELVPLNVQTASAVVASGGTGYTNGDVLTVVGGTGVASTFTVTGSSGGVITTVSVTTPGNYSVYPPSPASVTGGTGTGATFTLTPGLLATVINGIESSPIRTTGTTATRAADNIRMFGATLTNWFDQTQYTYLTQWNIPLAQNVIVPFGFANEGAPAFANTVYTSITAVSTISTPNVLSGGVGQFQYGGQTIDANTPGQRIVTAYQQDNFAVYTRKTGALGTDVLGVLPVATMDRMSLGSAPYGVSTPSNMFGYFERLVVWNVRIPNADMIEIGAREL